MKNTSLSHVTKTQPVDAKNAGLKKKKIKETVVRNAACEHESAAPPGESVDPSRRIRSIIFPVRPADDYSRNNPLSGSKKKYAANKEEKESTRSGWREIGFEGNARELASRSAPHSNATANVRGAGEHGWNLEQRKRPSLSAQSAEARSAWCESNKDANRNAGESWPPTSKERLSDSDATSGERVGNLPSPPLLAGPLKDRSGFEGALEGCARGDTSTTPPFFFSIE